MGVRDGRSLTLGGGRHVLVDAAELVVAAQGLRAARDGLDVADARLRAAAWQAAALAGDVPEAGALLDALDTLREVRWGPAALAQGVGELATRTRDAAAAYDLAESEAQARWAGVVGLLGLVVGTGPFGPVLLSGAAVAVAVGGLLLDEARQLAVDPFGALSPGEVRDDLDRLASVPQRVVADGRGALVLQLLAAALGSMTGAHGPHLDPVGGSRRTSRACSRRATCGWCRAPTRPTSPHRAASRTWSTSSRARMTTAPPRASRGRRWRRSPCSASTTPTARARGSWPSPAPGRQA
ncbi:hypothetical protein [Cellulomonas dongxiuzhuiae]|uniref:Uncharacterized protein n=1 Tax=Cellulomonas dongxiuzhuiae TaxID=2819979 RepID=A0ABX8GIZ7_9CELL|nr:hypothetical protein [Cellulomonas dongxiuzhuiae]MBO3094873.1 hypothetical protein [Cellulomonas dongxiuzhuiae]QWC15903.1 hypothetical protein KKR89_16875 [Cellulomonas dongxiuzhuiae]